MSSIQFNIQSLFALSPGLENPADWAKWQQNQCQWPGDAAAPASSAIPAMMRRRMSPLSKIVVQVAATLSASEDIVYSVFSSRHGELQRTVQLLQEILAGEPASPTAFSQSVHNTAAGLFTIATKKPIPATSLAGGVDGFHYALLEAFIYLNQHPDKKVLVVDFDAPLPEIYSQFEPYTNAPYAMGMVLKAGDQVQIQRAAPAPKPKDTTLPQALEFYRQWLNKTSSFEMESARQHWAWQVGDFKCSD
ncbi:beta-ketoacyl synthase chain length factor [Grimontia sp. NTOU-MAR1]|uniref:beta-ketoacyl synthase chain length factor n=1 Tax=Grimontia sp. NTOU-MAR1 TaxID=3111011 RepID=UPI002DB62D27|nr:beta-ketoacyl synthase chain length factor [Grimontia sp. NTOU-MAR1]WRV97182.1 beta-ketoacyl synthase chain length factor [Grimontia sp. NTOU-MAR1]